MGMKWPDSTDFRQRAENTLFSLVRFEKYLENCVFHYEQPLAGLVSPTSASGRTWFMFCRCFRWGSCHLKDECLVWTVLLVMFTDNGLASYPKMSGQYCPLQVFHSWLTKIGTMMPDVLQSEVNPAGLLSSLYPPFLGTCGVFVFLLCC